MTYIEAGERVGFTWAERNQRPLQGITGHIAGGIFVAGGGAWTPRMTREGDEQNGEDCVILKQACILSERSQKTIERICSRG